MFECLSHVVAVGAEEQVAVEGGDVAVRTVAATECCFADVETMVLDGVENAQTGVGGVARKQDYFNPRLLQ